MRFGRTLGRRDQEDEVGGAIGGAEVDARGEAREGEGGLGDGGALGVRDRDAAGEPGLILLLARPGVGEQRLGVGRAALRDDALRERSDDGSLVAAEPDVETDELRCDGLGHDDLQVGDADSGESSDVDIADRKVSG